MHHTFVFPPKIIRLIKTLAAAGAKECLLVGGTVRNFIQARDSFTELSSANEFDIEIYGLSYEQIVTALKKANFNCNLVGKSFGVIKVGNNIDVSIPRRESKNGSGHTGFDIEADPTMTFAEAASRRDFTINAIAMRVDGTILDVFGGQQDLQNKILRATSPKFAEDPLRVLRGMQFASRFNLTMEDDTIEMCRSLFSEFATISPERIWNEFRKWSLGENPSKGLEVLENTNWISAFPELAALVNVPQNPKWHPEGDVWTHTKLTCNAAAKIAHEMELSNDEKVVLMFAALCHDFGKPATTILNDKNNWSSPQHAEHGAALTCDFLNRMRAPHNIIEQVTTLVREHMAHMALPSSTDPNEKQVRRLAVRLAPSNIRMWCALCRADAKGCLARGTRIDSWEEVAEKLEVREAQPAPLLMGRDLLALEMKPGPEMGKLLKLAYEAQLDGVFHTQEESLVWLKNMGDL